MKKLVVIIAIVALVYVFVFVSKTSDNNETSNVNILAIETETGKASYYGEEARKGIELAEEYFRNEYPEFNFVINHADSANDPNTSISVYNNFTSQNKVDAVITQGSLPSLTIKPLANEDGILQMGVLTAASSFSGPSEGVFRASTAIGLETDYMSKFISDKGYKTISIIYFQNELGVSISKSLINSLENYSKETKVLQNEGYIQTSNDYRSILLKTKELNPDVIYVAGLGGEQGNLLKQARELGINQQFLGFRITEDVSFLATAGDLANGFVYTYNFDSADSSDEIQDFSRSFEQKYNNLPNGYNAEGYVGTLLLLDSYRKCGADNVCVRSELNKLEKESTIFGKISFDENGDIVTDIFLKTVVDGKFATLKNN